MSKGPSSGEANVPPAKALAAGGLVEYAEGAIVSRTLLENSAGSVTLFAFEAGQGLSEHTVPYEALVHVLEGEVELRLGGEPVRARAGQLVLMPANVPHGLSALGRFKMLLTMLRPD